MQAKQKHIVGTVRPHVFLILEQELEFLPIRELRTENIGIYSDSRRMRRIDVRRRRVRSSNRTGATFPEVEDPRIRKIVNVLEGQDLSKIDVDDIARNVNLSKSRLRHLFKLQTGISLGHHIKLLRLARAKSILNGSFLSVKQVMALVGYTDASHFARDYRMIFGERPSRTRSRK